MKHLLDENRKSWNVNAKFYFATTALPQYGCHLKTEKELNLFEDIKDKKFLELCFGSGHSMKYLAHEGAKEMWGVDISQEQKKVAETVLEDVEASFTLLTSPMEENPGIPENYFDVVYSIYGLGWTLDLEKTLDLVSSYLKPGGIFIFSWDHPLMPCVDEVDDQLLFTGNYHEDDLFSWQKNGQTLTLINRKFSTYINSLFKAGFIVEALIEESNEEKKDNEFKSNYYSEKKLKHFPLSFVIKARKKGL